MHYKIKVLTTVILLAICCSGFSQESGYEETKVTVNSEGWMLIGDLTIPNTKTSSSVPVVLLLNKANDTRQVYEELAEHLAVRGIASLRLDLRGHGESTNLGKFIPNEKSPNPLIWDAEKDVIAAVDFLKNHPRIDSTSLGVVGGSYSGEEMAEAGRLTGYLQAYVELSPGSFSDESIQSIDSSGVPWLFIVSKNERHLTEVTALVQQKSDSVELVILPGVHHATRILQHHKDMAERIAFWLATKLY